MPLFTGLNKEPIGPSDSGSGGGGIGTSIPTDIQPAVVIGLDLLRDSFKAPPEPETPPPTLEAITEERRRRSAYSEIKRKQGPVTSGLNL